MEREQRSREDLLLAQGLDGSRGEDGNELVEEKRWT
jgi:hypothetical protein